MKDIDTVIGRAVPVDPRVKVIDVELDGGSVEPVSPHDLLNSEVCITLPTSDLLIFAREVALMGEDAFIALPPTMQSISADLLKLATKLLQAVKK